MFFDTPKGQALMESIASFLNQIATALEENNRLMAKALQSDYGETLLAQNASTVNAAKAALRLRII